MWVFHKGLLWTNDKIMFLTSWPCPRDQSRGKIELYFYNMAFYSQFLIHFSLLDRRASLQRDVKKWNKTHCLVHLMFIRLLTLFTSVILPSALGSPSPSFSFFLLWTSGGEQWVNHTPQLKAQYHHNIICLYEACLLFSFPNYSYLTP